MFIPAGEHKIIISEKIDQTITVEQDATLVYIFFIDEQAKHDDVVWKLNGRCASLQAFGFDVRNTGVSELRIRLEHEPQHTTGKLWLTSVLENQAKSDVRTTLAITAKASQADGYIG